MNLKPGSLHVTNDFRTSSRFWPTDGFPPAICDPARFTEVNQPFATQGALAEAPWRADPAGLLAPYLPVGRRGRDSQHRTITVLLADDDVADVIAIRRSFWQLKMVNPLVVARNGIEALDILRGNNGCVKLEAPYVILLDLNMPRMGGIELLDELRRDPVLRRSLVFVMSASAAPEDLEQAYEKNIAGYVPKPAAGEDFTAAIGALESYWRAIEFPD